MLPFRVRTLALALLALTAAVVSAGVPTDQPSPRGGDKPEKEWMARHEQFVELAKKGGVDVYFEGDSITDFWRSAGKSVWEKEFAPLKAANFGIWGDYTQHVLYRITHGELEGVKPKVVVLMIGTNNAGGYPAKDVAAGIKAIVDSFHEKLPEARILLLGIFPRGATAHDPLRQKVDDINKIIAGLDDGQSVRFLNINAKFLDKDGNLSKEVMPDLIHPNAKGYQIWADAIREPLKEMLAR